ncbi:S-adenosyl-L-methionine-dependent methyltransferase [Phakopsora pachyrhizi]|uniref:S-adenosyl-L-methionine-dependent methyltransferase n=1 Tax=Phakopsora pachyrhizi TaxID=170000 RepID=A0AAV0BB74_PHAPC|nr:S-adenosyl-L-methionine-dependent methyltransferase [Phakopsora pachyrhizi]CAH7684509.1 S-adenosyl-L-methionine-dependent methyltransferase [Phakopsora pachyrhizi]CAH7689625.1 S-adenosyl-L-methionine-dependent methyltransferase [Phakopsora pachyrhizi]
MMTQQSPVITPTPTRQARYLLGRSSSESKRLSDQHEVLLKAAGGYIPVPLSIHPETIEAILDVGTGNAQWLLGLRQSGVISPATELWGIDVSKDMMPDSELGRSLGLSLEVRDLCEPLPSCWNNKFDFIHGRHVLIWIEPYKWPRILSNLWQALKPGGTLVIMYPGSTPYDSKTNIPLDSKSAPARLFSAFLKFSESSGFPRRAVAELPDLLVKAGFDPEWIMSKTSPIRIGRAEPEKCLQAASAHHLDFVLELILKHPYSQQLGCPSPDDEDGWRALFQEWRKSTDKGFCYDLHIIAARKPLLQ